jgi:hypothetical protein
MAPTRRSKPVRSLVPHGYLRPNLRQPAAENGPPDRVMIDSTHLKAHRTAASLLKRGIHPRFIGRTKGGLKSKLHAVCDGAGRSVIFLLTEGQMSDSMRYDRCAHTFFSAICIAATVIFWLGQ